MRLSLVEDNGLQLYSLPRERPTLYIFGFTTSRRRFHYHQCKCASNDAGLTPTALALRDDICVRSPHLLNKCVSNGVSTWHVTSPNHSIWSHSSLICLFSSFHSPYIASLTYLLIDLFNERQTQQHMPTQMRMRKLHSIEHHCNHPSLSLDNIIDNITA